ncbi:MAG: hypothetical protein WCI72_04180 [archaeon]
MPGSYTSELYDEQHGRGYWAPENSETEPEKKEPVYVEETTTWSRASGSNNRENRKISNKGQLENILQKVEFLRKDLFAEIIVKEEVEEVGYWTESGRNHSQVQGEDVWVITRYGEPQITKPNTEKRELAKTQLQQIYDGGEWYSSRYRAGEALKIPKEEFDKKIVEWIGYLKKDLHAEREIDAPLERHCSYNEVGLPTTGSIPDIEVRSRAQEDLNYLYKKTSDRAIGTLAGKALGYSKLRILLGL